MKTNNCKKLTTLLLASLLFAFAGRFCQADSPDTRILWKEPGLTIRELFGLPALTFTGPTRLNLDQRLMSVESRFVTVATTTALPTNTYTNGTSGIGATLTASANGALTIDGYNVSVGDRVLVKNESTSANDGVYVVTNAGGSSAAYVLTRALDQNAASEFTNVILQVIQGTTNANTAWYCSTTSTITLGASALSWSQWGAGGGGGSGSVTSVGLSLPTIFSVSGSPVTTSGTLTATLATESANTIFSGPSSGSAATPTFRTLAPSDLGSAVFGASGTSHSAGAVPDPGSTSGTTHYLREDGTWAVPSGGSGTVTSVGLSLPTDFNVTGSPVTISGTLTATYANESANKFLAGPSSGSPAAPTWRGIAAADLAGATFGASGSSHSAGAVPDPGNVAGSTRFLREDATWVSPAVTGQSFYTPPNSASFSWLNQGTATENDFTTYVKLNAVGVSGDSLKGRIMSTPGSNFTVIMAIVPVLTGLNFQQCGLLLYDSGSGKCVVLDIICDNTISSLPSCKVDKFNSTTSYNGNTVATAIFLPLNFYPMWLKIVQDSSHRTHYWSLDGANWNQLTQTANTDFITPDHLGYYCNANSGSAISMIVLSWSATSP